jgi:signal transduction histidine kinase
MMADAGMDYQEALKILTKMKDAAPPIAKSKLSGVIALLERMHQREQIAASKLSAIDPGVSRSRLPPPNERAVAPAPKRPPPRETVDRLFQDFDLEQFSIENMLTEDARRGIPPPDTSELFSDLPDFQPQREIEPHPLTLSAVLGIADPERMPSDLPAVMGWDEALQPAPDLFADIPRDLGDDAPLRELLAQIAPESAPPAEGAPAQVERDLRRSSPLLKRVETETPPLDAVFAGGVRTDGGIVPEEYAICEANAVGGQEALDELAAHAMGEASERRSGSDLPGAAALLANVREVLKPSLLLLRTQTELLRDRVDAALEERDAEMVRLMHDNAEMALTLLESLEMVMQLSENALDLQIGAFSALDLLRDAGERMQDRARLYRHRITVMLDRRLPLLRADYQRTLAILIDLMDNAVRYTPEGGSSRIAVDNLGRYVLFTVSDSGIGLSDADMRYIGQPFWRALHQPLVRAHRGTGLRLYLARRVLEMQGGALFFSGEPNVGSSFSFTVPVADGG